MQQQPECVQTVAGTQRETQCGWHAQVAHQGAAVLGLATVAMSEELGSAMAHRALEHLLQYGEPPVRCAGFCSQGLGEWRGLAPVSDMNKVQGASQAASALQRAATQKRTMFHMTSVGHISTQFIL